MLYKSTWNWSKLDYVQLKLLKNILTLNHVHGSYQILLLLFIDEDLSVPYPENQDLIFTMTSGSFNIRALPLQLAVSTLERVSPLTHAVGSVLKRVVVIVLSTIVFGMNSLLSIQNLPNRFFYIEFFCGWKIWQVIRSRRRLRSVLQ